MSVLGFIFEQQEKYNLSNHATMLCTLLGSILVNTYTDITGFNGILCYFSMIGTALLVYFSHAITVGIYQIFHTLKKGYLRLVRTKPKNRPTLYLEPMGLSRNRHNWSKIFDRRAYRVSRKINLLWEAFAILVFCSFPSILFVGFHQVYQDLDHKQSLYIAVIPALILFQIVIWVFPELLKDPDLWENPRARIRVYGFEVVRYSHLFTFLTSIFTFPYFIFVAIIDVVYTKI